MGTFEVGTLAVGPRDKRMGERWGIPPEWAYQVTRAANAIDKVLMVGSSPNNVTKTNQRNVRVTWCGLPPNLSRDTISEAIRGISQSLRLAHWGLDISAGQLCIDATPILPGPSAPTALRVGLDIPDYRSVPATQTSTIDAPANLASEFNAAIESVDKKLKQRVTSHYVRVLARMMAVTSRLCTCPSVTFASDNIAFKLAAEDAAGGRSFNVSITISPVKLLPGDKLVEVLTDNPWWDFDASSSTKRIVFSICVPAKEHS